MIYDFLVVGQGLAGAALSYELIKKQQKVLVIDNEYVHSASRVAAGLFNPIIGNEFKKTWLADTLFPHLLEFYGEIEQITRRKFIYPMPIYRPFHSIEQQNSCLAESIDSVFKAYFNTQTDIEAYHEILQQPYGGIEVLRGGYVDTLAYLEGVRDWLIAQGAYWQHDFEDEALQITDEGVAYGAIRAKQIIFCRGRKDATSPFWSWLPFKHAKGDILQIRFGGEGYPTIIIKGCWIIPRKDGTYRVGSNYDWTDLSDTPSEKAKLEIIEKLESLTALPYELLGQQAGIRPTNTDRRPFIGQHPKYSNLFIFNGLGTKGVSLSPYFATQMVAYLLKQIPLEKSVTIQRHFHFFS